VRKPVLIWLLLAWLVVPLAQGSEPVRVEVSAPYIELHTGPGRGYPIFYVAERGESVEILLRKTDWFKVRTARGKQGWVARAQIEQTQLAAGQPLRLADAGRDDYNRRRWELGAMGGSFGGADIITAYGGYAFASTLATELALSQVLGTYSDSLMLTVNLVAQPFPEWRVSPFFVLGSGVMHTNPKVTLVQSQSRLDSATHVGLGARTYLARRLLLRAEYNNYVVYQNKDSNQRINEWKIGFSVFF
jgi:uncharacterized protein YgiM (DUF1202 family)